MNNEKKNLVFKNLQRSHPPSLCKLLRHNYKDWKLIERLFFKSVGLFQWSYMACLIDETIKALEKN